jgi:hypothetical protein
MRLLEIAQKLSKIKKLQLKSLRLNQNNSDQVYIEPANYDNFIKYINNIKELLSIEIVNYRNINQALASNYENNESIILSSSLVDNINRELTDLHSHMILIKTFLDKKTQPHCKNNICIKIPTNQEVDCEFKTFKNYIQDIDTLIEDIKNTGITTEIYFNNFNTGSNWIELLIGRININVNLDVDVNVDVDVLFVIGFLFAIIKISNSLITKDKVTETLKLTHPESTKDDLLKLYAHAVKNDINNKTTEYVKSLTPEQNKIFNGRAENEIITATKILINHLVEMNKKGFEIEPSLNPPSFIEKEQDKFYINHDKLSELKFKEENMAEEHKQIESKISKE